MTNTQKTYPFNMERHAHDLNFLRNRLYNIIIEKESKGINASYETSYRNNITELLDAPRTGDISWLTGKQLKLAREAVGWACSQRC